MKIYVILGCFLTLLFSCKESNNNKNIDSTYLGALNQNREIRAENRVNYLELTGLFKLDSTSNTFGSAESNKFVLAVKNIAQTIGRLDLSEDALWFYAEQGVKITTVDGEEIDSLALTIDTNGNSIQLFHNQLKWQVITRSGALYLRVWDLNNPAIDAFKGFESYEINSDFIFDANFSYYDRSRSESVASKLGIDEVMVFIGQVQFVYNDTPYSLEIGQEGFVMVGDLTSGETTYGGGRYMYLELPETDGQIRLDFNYLYNPPCAYSEYTTCLFPPRQNQLDIKIKAGELLQKRI